MKRLARWLRRFYGKRVVDDAICPALVNAGEEGLMVGDYSWETLKEGDTVKVLGRLPGEKRFAPVWVRVTKIVRHPHPDYNVITGIVQQGDAGIATGATIKFGRINIAQVA